MGDTIEKLAQMLAKAHRDPNLKVSATAFAELDFAGAQIVQAETRRLLGQTAPVSKVAIDGQGRAIAAPIYGGLVATSGRTIDLPPGGWLGIEVEIAARLARTVTPELAARGTVGVLEAIESFHVGIEIVGSRYDDRLAAGANGALADNMNTAGYVWSPAPWTRGIDVANLPIVVAIDGAVRWEGRSKAPFGELLDPVIAYAKRPLAFSALDAGMLVTTGTLCGLIEVGTPTHFSARIADAAAVEFTVRHAAQTRS